MSRSVHAIFQKAHDEGLTLTQVLILFLLNDSSATMTKVASALKFTTSAATGSVDRLEKFGLVARHHDPSDRRVITASITEAGRAKLTSLNSIR